MKAEAGKNRNGSDDTRKILQRFAIDSKTEFSAKIIILENAKSTMKFIFHQWISVDVS